MSRRDERRTLSAESEITCKYTGHPSTAPAIDVTACLTCSHPAIATDQKGAKNPRQIAGNRMHLSHNFSSASNSSLDILLKT